MLFQEMQNFIHRFAHEIRMPFLFNGQRSGDIARVVVDEIIDGAGVKNTGVARAVFDILVDGWRLMVVGGYIAAQAIHQARI